MPRRLRIALASARDLPRGARSGIAKTDVGAVNGVERFCLGERDEPGDLAILRSSSSRSLVTSSMMAPSARNARRPSWPTGRRSVTGAGSPSSKRFSMASSRSEAS